MYKIKNFMVAHMKVTQYGIYVVKFSIDETLVRQLIIDNIYCRAGFSSLRQGFCSPELAGDGLLVYAIHAHDPHMLRYACIYVCM